MKILVLGDCHVDDEQDLSRFSLASYWRGLVLLDSWKPGRFDIETFSLGRLERLYQ